MDDSYSPYHGTSHDHDLDAILTSAYSQAHSAALSPPTPLHARQPARQPAPQPVMAPAMPPEMAPATAPDIMNRGQVLLDNIVLRHLRQSRLMSQQDLADDCWRRNIQVSIATIKRAESGRAVRFRIARELARYFDVSIDRLLRGATPATAGRPYA